jgi:hypothetical protein
MSLRENFWTIIATYSWIVILQISHKLDSSVIASFFITTDYYIHLHYVPHSNSTP